jgi:drug/metabolite transporter (DMT)-like permease
MKNNGVAYMLTGVFFFTIMNIMIKYIPEIGAVEIVFFRSLVSLIMSYVMIRRLGLSIWGNNKKWLIIRGIAGSVGLLLFFVTIKEIPLGSAIAIQFLSPIFTSVLGIYIVKEKVQPIQWLFFALAFAGVLAIQGFDERVPMIYALVGLIGGIGAGLAYNSIRKLKTSDHPLVIIFYFPLITLPITGLYLIWHWQTPNLFELVMLLGIGVVTQFAQYFMTKAYQLDELSKISSIQYIGIIFALFFGFVLFDETYSIYSGLGILLILLGVILNVSYKNRLSKKAIESE